MQKKAFISKVFQMSSVMLFLNISDIFYNMYISKMAGAEGIGTYHLVMSVFSLAITLSVSGMGLSLTRLISDMPYSLAKKCAGSVSKKCLRIVCLTSLGCGVILFLSAGFMGERILKNPDCTICLKTLSPALLPIGVSAVITGYFTAFGNVGAISCAKAVSEAVIWIATMCFLRVYPPDKTYMAVVNALVLSVSAEGLCLMILRRRSLNFLYCKNGADYKSILQLSCPIALGSYLRTGLSSAENLLIPSMLAVYGVANPVARYGVLKGMTLPMLMFPFVFIGAFSSLIVPEIARRRSLGLKNGIKYISTLSLEYVLKFGFFVSAVFLKWHNFFGEKFFGVPDAGKYLGFLSLFPLFYFADSLVDSVLKGMDEQVASLKINVVDSVCRVGLTIIFIPLFGMTAYIGIMYLSEMVNLFFSYKKLKKVSGIKLPFKNGIFIPIASLTVSLAAVSAFYFLNPWQGICSLGGFYIVFLMIFGKIFKN